MLRRAGSRRAEQPRCRRQSSVFRHRAQPGQRLSAELDSKGRIAYCVELLEQVGTAMLNAGSFAARVRPATGLLELRAKKEQGREHAVLLKMAFGSGEDWEARLRDYFARRGRILSAQTERDGVSMNFTFPANVN